MEYEMTLRPEPFAAVRAGYKTIELRLYDEKRRLLLPGDTIRFTCTADPSASVVRRIAALRVFSDFAALYRELPLLRCGYAPFTLPEADPADMEAFYSREEQALHQVVGIVLEEAPLQRFLPGHAGEIPGCSGFEKALAEVRSGLKTTHWIWYLFPQLRGLTIDPVTEYYALDGTSEAQAFLGHPVLGMHLRELTQAVLDLGLDDPMAIFGRTDAHKLHASMTLFDHLAPEDVFGRVLEQYCMGMPQADTMALLEK